MPAIAARDCIRCGVLKVHMISIGNVAVGPRKYEVAFRCSSCGGLSIYHVYSGSDLHNNNINTDRAEGVICDIEPILNVVAAPTLHEDVPARIVHIFSQAAKSRRMQMYDASGAMFRKTIDVSTKHIYATDARLADRNAADALRVRIRALGEMKILEDDIIDLADVVTVDGNDAAHEMDPYTAEEAEALEELTLDLIDRLFVRPARVARVKAKQLAAGQRKS